jgi:hypothetical protein
MRAGRRTRNDIRDMVVDPARRQNVIGVDFDTCRHVLSARDGHANGIILDSLKTVLKNRPCS